LIVGGWKFDVGGFSTSNPNVQHPTSNIKYPTMKLLTHIPAFLKNKYFISLAAFCVIILFLDKNDFFTQNGRLKELRKLQQSKKYYTTQIAAERKELEALKTNPAAVEKLAREKYLMKRDNEELFLVPESSDKPKN
jgi:cell division protein FtsB